MRALVVDASPDRRRALRGELERHGHEVLEADDVPGALQAAAEEAPGLITVSWRVGDDDGVELAQVLTGQRPDEPPIVVVVGEDAEVDPIRALDAGAADVWTLEAEQDPGALAVRLALAEFYARLQAEHVRVGGEFALLRRALDLTGTGFILTDPRLDDNPIVYANQSFYDLTGYPPEEVLGHNCRFLQGPATDAADIDLIRNAVAERRPVTVELVNHKRDGTEFVNEVHISPVHDERGEVVRFVGVQLDVTRYRRQDRLLSAERQARRAAERAERRSAFLAEASPLLDEQLDLRRTLETLTRVTVPWLADACLVDVIEHGEVRRIALAADDPRTERLLRALPATYPVEDDTFIARALQGDRAQVIDDEAGTVLGPAARALLERGALPNNEPLKAMTVPLKARGTTIGVLVLLALRADREFDGESRVLAEDLGRRAALALDNARLYEQSDHIAQTLQRSLLPEELPSVDGLKLAARFHPAGTGQEIGGDFYDAFSARGGALAMVIGDVTGKGAPAAALTALTRHTVRVAAHYETAPSGVLRALNRALLSSRVDLGRYCTAIVCRLEPARDGGPTRASVSLAGHPPALVLRADGAVETVGRPGTLLGWVEEPGLEDVGVDLHPGDALVLYTDGVSEAKLPTGDRLGEHGVEELVAEAQDEDADGLADRLVSAATALGEPSDDVAVLVVRVDHEGIDSDVFERVAAQVDPV